uniref:C3H1-type domain-containing protein n=1 Tax=Peronospora matthiolae TaxID=2874970 RepID=A0AAV1U1A2_9STRA
MQTTSSDATNSSSSTCRFFQSSRGCFRGGSCAFRHDLSFCIGTAQDAVEKHVVTHGDATTNTNRSMSKSNFVSESLDSRACRFFASSSGCRNGTTCPYAHGASEGAFGAVRSDEGLRRLSRTVQQQQPPLPPDYSEGSNVDGDSGSVVYYNYQYKNQQQQHQYSDQLQHFQHLDLHGPSSADTGDEYLGYHATEFVSARQKGQRHGKDAQKTETICEILPVLTRVIQGPFFAIDVECVATGSGNDDRDVARIAVVDEDEQVVFDQYVKPTKPVVSYLTQLTGITARNLADAPDLKEALVRLKKVLPVESVIVGQSIKKDLEWLMLKKPTDYKGEFDVADLFRLPMQSMNGVVRYRYFSLRHVAKHLLGHEIQEADHDPVIDARYAMKVFKKFRYLHESPEQRDAVLQTLLKTPRTPSFAERYPEIDGVSMRATWKRSPSPVLQNANRVTTGYAQRASNGGFSPEYHQEHEQKPLSL